ncbi:MAG: putative lipoprotein [Acidobacteriales bacterium]|nr:putative lipoprotein [Terriglobales bacterium]
MKTRNRFVLPVMFLFLSAASFAQQVKTDYDRSANFAQYKTYSWQKVDTRDPLWEGRIKSAVDQALTAKGWTQVPSGGDVSLVAMETTKNQQSLNTFYNGFGGGWRWGGFGDSTTTVDNYKVGTLLLDMFDTQSKKLLWRGSASDTLSNKSDKNIKNLDKGVQKMLKDFPPGATKK